MARDSQISSSFRWSGADGPVQHGKNNDCAPTCFPRVFPSHAQVAEDTGMSLVVVVLCRRRRFQASKAASRTKRTQF